MRTHGCTHAATQTHYVQTHTNNWSGHSQAEILICALYVCAHPGMSFKRGRGKGGKKRKRGGGETPGSGCWEKSSAGYCTVVVGRHRMGVVIMCVCVCVLILELSHWHRSTPPSSGSSQLIKLALFFLSAIRCWDVSQQKAGRTHCYTVRAGINRIKIAESLR